MDDSSTHRGEKGPLPKNKAVIWPAEGGVEGGRPAGVVDMQPQAGDGREVAVVVDMPFFFVSSFLRFDERTRGVSQGFSSGELLSSGL